MGVLFVRAHRLLWGDCGNASHIFSFRVSGDDSEQIAKNFGNKDTAPELVMLPNYQFKALTMQDNEPLASDPVMLNDRPELLGYEMPEEFSEHL